MKNIHEANYSENSGNGENISEENTLIENQLPKNYGSNKQNNY